MGSLHVGPSMAAWESSLMMVVLMVGFFALAAAFALWLERHEYRGRARTDRLVRPLVYLVVALVRPEKF